MHARIYVRNTRSNVIVHTFQLIIYRYMYVKIIFLTLLYIHHSHRSGYWSYGNM